MHILIIRRICQNEWWRAYAWIINFETLYGGLNIAYLWSYIAWVKLIFDKFDIESLIFNNFWYSK